MRRRRFLIGASAASVALATGGTFALVRGSDADGANGSDGNSRESSTSPATAEVTRRDLEERAELTGTLGYGDTSEVALDAAGRITALPELGTVIDRGQTVVEVDGLPIPLLFGSRPFWRQLGPDADDGLDIQQLEENLVALGIVSADDLTVDQEWTSATTEAVEDWQESLGREETGVVAPGDAVVLPGALRVAGHPTPVGGPAGGTVLSVTETGRRVSIDLEADRQTLVTLNQAVQVEMPDGTMLPGRVTEIGRVAQAEADDGNPTTDPSSTIEVVVTLEDASVVGSLDEAPVTVLVVTGAAQGVLAVPVDALMALAEGGYAVEVVGSGGTTQLVPIETGAFADGWVEITGDVAEGDLVVVPA